MEHTNGVKEISAVKIITPYTGRSAECEAISHLAQKVFAHGNGHLMEVSFDGGLRGRTADCRPALPLILRW
jgi:hypothetical protein